MGDDETIKQFPSKRIVRPPEVVKRLVIEEAVLRDPRMQQVRIPTILETISQIRWFKNVDDIDNLRAELPKTREQLGMLLVGTDEKDWKGNPLRYWVLCTAYLDAMREERSRSSDELGDSDPPE